MNDNTLWLGTLAAPIEIYWLKGEQDQSTYAFINDTDSLVWVENGL